MTWLLVVLMVSGYGGASITTIMVTEQQCKAAVELRFDRVACVSPDGKVFTKQ